MFTSTDTSLNKGDIFEFVAVSHVIQIVHSKYCYFAIAGGALTKIRDLTKNLRKSSRDGMTTSLGSSSTLTATGTNGSVRGGGPSNGSVVTPR